jgi:ATP/maltotriose-dependent transcriptional regulator MalT
VSETNSTASSPARVWQGTPLLATKLHLSPPRSNMVACSQVLGTLDEGLSNPLILVSAPAGFGKTTLLGQWIATRGLRCAWLSLDPADNEPIRFCTSISGSHRYVLDRWPDTAQAFLLWTSVPERLYDRFAEPLRACLQQAQLDSLPQLHRGAAEWCERHGQVEPLSEREVDVLRLVSQGFSNEQIAEQLIIAIGTVKAHVHHIYGKLEVSGRVQALVRARELGLL